MAGRMRTPPTRRTSKGRAPPEAVAEGGASRARPGRGQPVLHRPRGRGGTWGRSRGIAGHKTLPGVGGPRISRGERIRAGARSQLRPPRSACRPVHPLEPSWPRPRNARRCRTRPRRSCQCIGRIPPRTSRERSMARRGSLRPPSRRRASAARPFRSLPRVGARASPRSPSGRWASCDARAHPARARVHALELSAYCGRPSSVM
mmetsp:Transcript_1734/g.6839  ORF Transcript_1734/g.6839 Transcript_1734/m.6839 type:complete len:204 (-) Transcript_1734:757-1368(-)